MASPRKVKPQTAATAGVPSVLTKTPAKGGSTISGGQIASTAQGYAGKLPYRYGGVPANGGVDCSSFVNMILGWRLGLAIPGYAAGKYKGQSHGPVVVQYAAWGGAVTVPTAAAGDLCVFAGFGPLGHIGIALSSTQMVSALNPSSGIVVTAIKGMGPAGAPLSYRRVKATTSTGTAATLTSSTGSTGSGSSAASGCRSSLLLLPMLPLLALIRRLDDQPAPSQIRHVVTDFEDAGGQFAGAGADAAPC